MKTSTTVCHKFQKHPKNSSYNNRTQVVCSLALAIDCAGCVVEFILTRGKGEKTTYLRWRHVTITRGNWKAGDWSSSNSSSSNSGIGSELPRLDGRSTRSACRPSSTWSYSAVGSGSSTRPPCSLSCSLSVLLPLLAAIEIYSNHFSQIRSWELEWTWMDGIGLVTSVDILGAWIV